MSTYTNQIRTLAQLLQNGENVPVESLVITLNEAAQKIDELGDLVDYLNRVE